MCRVLKASVDFCSVSMCGEVLTRSRQYYRCTIAIILMVMFIMMRWYEIHQTESNGMRHVADDDCRGNLRATWSFTPPCKPRLKISLRLEYHDESPEMNESDWMSKNFRVKNTFLETIFLFLRLLSRLLSQNGTTSVFVPLTIQYNNPNTTKTTNKSKQK